MSFERNLNFNKCIGKKKNFSYAALISQALINSSDNRLTLKEIYNYISTNYPEFTARKKGWQNSIRHNLSLNKAFFKEPKLKGTPGKGSYWSINHSEAKMILNKSDSLLHSNSRMRRGYGHTNQLTQRRKSPFLDVIRTTDDNKPKNEQTIIFNGNLNPYNESLETFFGLNYQKDQEEDEDSNKDKFGYQPFFGMNQYFKF